MIKVLLIEDRAAEAAEIASLLGEAERETFDVTSEASVADGVERLAEESFDVVLLELRTAGGEDVPEVTHLKELAPMLPIVVLCSREERDRAIRAVEIGAEDHVENEHRSAEVLTRAIQYAIERVDATARLAFLSRNDPLTGLVNRAVFRDRLAQALARSDRSQKPGALLLVDIDSFKAINESFGSDAGDRLLQHLGAKLENVVRPYDVVARLGGDEFAILLEDVEDVEDAVLVTQRVREVIAEPVLVGEREILSTASIGATIFPADAAEPPALLRNAGLALDRAKRQGGDTASFYMDVFGRRSPRGLATL